MSSGNLTVSGATGGKKVNVVPAVQPAYALLEKAALDGNYWARLAISGIRALTSGRMGKDNIYVRPGNIVTQNFEQFFVFLPGCKATCERRADDQYYLVNLTLDKSYSDVKNDIQKTGLYKATKRDDKWDAEYYSRPRSDAKAGEIRITAITDGHHADVEKAVNAIAGSIGKAPDAPSGKNFQIMDVHYTHKKGRLGGLVNFSKARKPLGNDDIRGSAMLLARSMIKSKDQKISWVSEKGGSAVLTQALRMVADANVKLGEHNIYLYDPTTSTNEALKMAQRAGVTPDRNVVQTGIFNYMGNRDQLPAIINRYRSEEGYTAGNAIYDLVGQGGKAYAPIGIGISALTLAGISITAPVIPIMTAIAGALGVGATGVAALKLGDTLVSNIAPHFYNRHIGKIK